MKNNFLALGEVIIDKVVIDNKVISENIGGAPLNVASMVAKFDNVNSSYLTILNRDNNESLKILKTIIKEKINPFYLLFKDNLNIAYSLVKVFEDGERTFSFKLDKASFLSLKEKDITKKKIINNDLFYLGTVSLLNKNTILAHHKLLRLANKYNKIIAFDPNYRSNLFKENKWIALTKEILKKITILKMSYEESVIFTRLNDLDIILEKLKNDYPNIKLILITLGEKGSILYKVSDSLKIVLEPIKVNPEEIKDAIGCGDAFFGAFLGYLLNNNVKTIENLEALAKKELLSAMEYANAAGSFTIQHAGALPMPTISHLKKLINVSYR